MKAKGKNAGKMLNQQQIIRKYGVTKRIIQKCFPKPQLMRVRGRGGAWWNVSVWPEEQVERTLKSPELSEILLEKNNQALAYRQSEEIRRIFREFSPESYIEEARGLQRTFVLHVGPANSGKTYEAIEDLKRNRPGTYLGPLRLLALEMYDKINAAGIPCSMLTGEETITVENAEIVSSTIELCNYREKFRTAVIDEAQLIADPGRGASWLKAICLVNADVVHICMAPEALKFIESLITRFSDQYSVVHHERLAPLRYGGICCGYQDLKPDDALICFSRKSVLSTAALLEKNGFRASVIYGALPPEARRNEVRKYVSGETDIVVATDAIGLGISLPIKRIVFAETEKYDGREFRTINTAEIKQISGRAGRYGLNEYGEVLVFGNKTIIEENLGKRVRDIRSACIAFPREVLGSGYPISLLLRTWQGMEKCREFVREDVHDALILLQMLKGIKEIETDKELIFDLITCPVDTKTAELVNYWTQCAIAVIRNKRIPMPYFGTETLSDCELQYKAFDIHHQLLRRIGRSDDCTAQRRAICDRIAELMKQDKQVYIRKCRGCGKELAIGTVFNYCEQCYETGIGARYCH